MERYRQRRSYRDRKRKDFLEEVQVKEIKVDKQRLFVLNVGIEKDFLREFQERFEKLFGDFSLQVKIFLSLVMVSEVSDVVFLSSMVLQCYSCVWVCEGIENKSIEFRFLSRLKRIFSEFRKKIVFRLEYLWNGFEMMMSSLRRRAQTEKIEVGEAFSKVLQERRQF